MLVWRELHLLSLMLTNCWLSLISQILSVPQRQSLPVFISDIWPALPWKRKGSGSHNYPVVRKSRNLARHQRWKPWLIWSGSRQSNKALKKCCCKYSEKTKPAQRFWPDAVRTLSSVASWFTGYKTLGLLLICISKKIILPVWTTRDWTKQLDHNKYQKVNMRHWLRT